MTQPNLNELAKQGNPNAIATLLNRSLQPQGISVKASLKDGCLHLMLEAAQIPNQQVLVSFVQKFLLNLQAAPITSAKLYAQISGMASPAWIGKFDLPTQAMAVNETSSKGIYTKGDRLRELAEQGNIDAIVTLLSRLFASEDVLVAAEFQHSCLQIILKSSVIPDRETSLNLLRQEITSWQSKAIETIEIYGQKLDEAFPTWSEQVELIPRLNLASDSTLTKAEKIAKSEFLTSFKTFQFDSIIPYKETLEANLYQDNTIKFLLFFSLFPWTLRLLAGEVGLESIAWLLGIYYAVIWGIVLRNLIKPKEFSWSLTVQCVVFTAFIGISLLLFAQRIPPFSIFYSAIHVNNLDIISQIVGFVLGVGLLEESCKALPVYLFLLRAGRLNNPLTSAFYGAMSGLGFAIAEGANYSVMYALGLERGDLRLEDYVLINTIRLVSLPLFHAVWAGIVGYFLGLAAINPSRQSTIIWIGIAVSAVLHGSYDTFSETLLGFVILAFSILLFVAYLRRSKHLSDEMQEAERSFQTWKSKSVNKD